MTVPWEPCGTGTIVPGTTTRYDRNRVRIVEETEGTESLRVERRWTEERTMSPPARFFTGVTSARTVLCT